MSKLLTGGERQKGFTLIEMSIVLVIIGLIIGGILKGQEIINASRQKNFITQVDGIRSAINTFNDKFASLPGDFKNATTRLAAGSVNGNGNGLVGVDNTNATLLTDTADTAGGAAGANVAGDANENLNFWCQLSFARLIGGSSTDCSANATAFGGGSPLPTTAYPAVGLDVAYGLWDTTTSSSPVRTLWLRAHRTVGAITNASAALSARDMYQIDSKYDDGTPGGGSIRSAGTGAANTCPIATAASVYTATSEQQDCVPLIALVY